MKHIKRSKRITRENLSTEDLLFLEELKARTDLLFLKHYAYGILSRADKANLDDVDSLLIRLSIRQASDAPQELTKEFLETTSQMLDRLVEKKGFRSPRVLNGAANLSDSLIALIPHLSS